MARFLLVDDDEEVITIISKVITSIDPKSAIKGASNGAKALQELERERFDILITDLKMDVVNGIDLIKNINRITKSPPIILVCSAHQQMVGNDIADLIYDYLIKPPNLPEIREKIEKILETRAFNSENESAGIFKRIFGVLGRSG